MAYRSPENVQRNELVRFDSDSVIRLPGNTQGQEKRGYKFIVENRGNFLDWFNAFFEIQFKMDLKANGGDNADQLSTVINGSHSFIKHLVIKSGGKNIYDTDNLHLVTFVKNLLEYSDDYSRGVTKNSFWYLDTGTTAVDAQNVGFAARRALTSNRKQVNVKIPLNRYSIFQELEGRILPPMQVVFEIEFNPDAELLFGSVDTTRVTIDRFFLWVPKIVPKDSLMTKYISDFQNPSRWKYLKKKHFSSAVPRNAVDYRIDISIINARHVFVYLQRLKTNEIEQNPYLFDTFNITGADPAVTWLNTCRLEYGDGVFYIEVGYEESNTIRIFTDPMAYSWKENDYNTGTQLNVHNHSSLYPLIYFDLTYQADSATRDPKKLLFKYTINQASTVDYQVHAIVLYEEELVVD